MTTTTMRDLRANMKVHFDALENDKEVLLIPRQGDKEAIVIMTLSEYSSIVETDYLLSSTENRKVMEKALKELDGNKVKELKPEDL